MRQGTLFVKTRREAPKDEISQSAVALIRAGFIHKEMSGVYSYLPLGLIVKDKIISIIRGHMLSLGASEIFMSALQDRAVWDATGRSSDEVVDTLFKTSLKTGTETILAFTHEEPIVRMMKEHLNSYKDLPAYVFQFQIKFRNELRAKSGLMRGREFLMKDLYSFSIDKDKHDEFYERTKNAYIAAFKELGLGEVTYLTFAGGGSFSQFSHEFQTLCEVGEDTIYVSPQKGIAINKEVYNDEVLEQLGIDAKELEEKKAIEVGNIFTLGTRFSEALGLFVHNENGERIPVFMGSYGIGIDRVLGVIAELNIKDDGLIWPRNISPFTVHLLNLANQNEKAKDKAEKIYNFLISKGIEVLYDDRELGAGSKLNDSDLIGIPFRVIVGDRNANDEKCEFIDRKTGENLNLSLEELLGKCLAD
jgi:prolyl-tRNA synthetase